MVTEHLTSNNYKQIYCFAIKFYNDFLKLVLQITANNFVLLENNKYMVFNRYGCIYIHLDLTLKFISRTNFKSDIVRISPKDSKSTATSQF